MYITFFLGMIFSIAAVASSVLVLIMFLILHMKGHLTAVQMICLSILTILLFTVMSTILLLILWR